MGGLVGLFLAYPAEWGPAVLRTVRYYYRVLWSATTVRRYVVHSNATVGEVEMEMERKS